MLGDNLHNVRSKISVEDRNYIRNKIHDKWALTQRYTYLSYATQRKASI